MSVKEERTDGRTESLVSNIGDKKNQKIAKNLKRNFFQK